MIPVRPYKYAPKGAVVRFKTGARVDDINSITQLMRTGRFETVRLVVSFGNKGTLVLQYCVYDNGTGDAQALSA